MRRLKRLRQDEGDEVMRTIFLAGALLALSACGGDSDTASDANALAEDNMMMDPNLMADPNLSADATGNLGANAAVDANTQNLMEKDAATNDADTNLANGL